MTGYNEAFIIDGKKKDELIAQDPKSAEIIRPILRGRDIKRYGYDFADKWLISTFPSKSYNIDDFPAVKNYLLGFKPKLKQTGEKLTNEEIQQVIKHAEKNGIQLNEKDLKTSRKKTTNKWFETQDSIGYWEEFSKQKIVWKAVGKNLTFSLLEPDFFLTAPASFITTNSELETLYLLGFLSSDYCKYFIYNNSDTTGAGDIMLNIQSLEKIPIPQIENMSKVADIVKHIIIYKQNGSDIRIFERKLNNLINEIFAFSEDEIKFIGSQ